LNTYVLLTILLLAGSDAWAKVYSLEQLIANALKNSIELQLAKKKIEFTELQIQEIYSHAFPSIALSLNAYHYYQYTIPYTFIDDNESYQTNWTSANRAIGVLPSDDYSSIRSITPGQLLASEDGDYSGMRPKNIMMPSLIVQQPLFMQGKMYLQLKIARFAQAMSVCNYEAVKNSVVGETTKKYYALLIEQERCAVNNKCKSIVAEHHRLNNVNYAFAHADVIDTLESSLLLEQANLDIVHSESERNKTAEMLIEQCYVAESPATIRIDGKFPEPVFFITIEEAIAKLYEANNQVKQFKGAENIQNGNISLAKLAYLPIIYAGGELAKIGAFSALRNPLHLQWNDDRRIFVGITWQLSSGLSTQRIIQQQVNQREQLLLSQQKTIQNLELKTRTLYADILVMKERLTILKRMIGLSEKKYDAVKVANGTGCGTDLEVQSAELELQKSRLRYDEQLYLFHSSVIDFKLLIGSMQGF
jgi:outer membrane protein TolC